MTKPRIAVKEVSKSFRIPVGAPYTLKQRILNPFHRTEWLNFGALNNVSFDVNDGEFFGIVGRNGCGKSTLLKLLSGIYHPDTGSIKTRGSIAPLIELGVGFNHELSARDNVYINGTLMGLTAKQLDAVFDDIVEFSELEQFMDLKLRNYSSGMVVRLAFAIAIHAHADILLADEVLAVGDERFQQKCFEVFRQRRKAGQTVVFVTHDMDAMQQFCDKAILLEQGKMVMQGDPRQVARAYRSINLGEKPETAVTKAGTADAMTLKCCTVNGQLSEEKDIRIPPDDEIRIEVTWVATEPVDHPIFSFSITDEYGRYAVRSNTLWQGTEVFAMGTGDEQTVRFSFTNQLAGAEYDVSVGVATDHGAKMLGIVDRAVSFTSAADFATGGVFDPDLTVEALR